MEAGPRTAGGNPGTGKTAEQGASPSPRHTPTNHSGNQPSRETRSPNRNATATSEPVERCEGRTRSTTPTGGGAFVRNHHDNDDHGHKPSTRRRVKRSARQPVQPSNQEPAKTQPQREPQPNPSPRHAPTTARSRSKPKPKTKRNPNPQSKPVKWCESRTRSTNREPAKR